MRLVSGHLEEDSIHGAIMAASETFMKSVVYPTSGACPGRERGPPPSSGNEKQEGDPLDRMHERNEHPQSVTRRYKSTSGLSSQATFCLRLPSVINISISGEGKRCRKPSRRVFMRELPNSRLPARSPLLGTRVNYRALIMGQIMLIYDPARFF